MSSAVLGSAAPYNTPQLEVLDLRHFPAARLRPLLQDQARRWERRLFWDYISATELLLEYLDSRVLPGFVALYKGQIVGYTFCVFEGGKAVIGDVYAFNETESLTNPVCDLLLNHLLEMLQHTPGIERIESQLLMFPAGGLAAPLEAHRFRMTERLFMLCRLPAGSAPLAQPTPPEGLQLLAWQPGFYEPAAELIYAAYREHGDSNINDQYRTVAGSQRFLHNIIRFPGCGVFTAENSWVLRDTRTGRLHGALLSSRVRNDVGHITQLCVSPAVRGRGLGRLLLESCLAELQRQGGAAVSLTVTDGNASAKRLYDDLGFETLHRFDALVWDAPPQ